MATERNEIITTIIFDDSQLTGANARVNRVVREVEQVTARATTTAQQGATQAAAAINKQAQEVSSLTKEVERYNDAFIKAGGNDRFGGGISGQGLSFEETRKKLALQEEYDKAQLKRAEMRQRIDTHVDAIKAGFGSRDRDAEISPRVQEMRALRREAELAGRSVDDLNRKSGRNSDGSFRRTAASALAMYLGSSVPGLSQGIGVAETARLSGSSMLSAGALGLAAGGGQLVIEASKKLLDQANARLDRQVKISAEYNKQYFAIKSLNDAFDQRVTNAANDREFDDNLGRNQVNVEWLETSRANTLAQLKILKDSRDRLMKDGDNLASQAELKTVETDIARLENRVLTLNSSVAGAKKRLSGFSEAELQRIEQERKEGISKLQSYYNREVELTRGHVGKMREILSESQGNQQFMASNEGQDFVYQLNEKIKDSVKQGQQIAREYGKTWNNVFTQMHREHVSNNPIALVFMDAQRAIDDLREAVKALPKDIQETALAMQRELNANKLFEARVDSALEVGDLREQARKFRDTSKEDRAFSMRVYQAEIVEFNRRLQLGVITNTEANLQYFRDRLSVINKNLQGDEAKEALKAQYEQEVESIMGMSGVNTQARLEYARDKYQTNLKKVTTEEQDRFDRQAKLLSQFSPQNETQRAVVEARLVRMAQSMNPDSLRADQRQMAADLLERTADRREKQQAEAVDQMKKQLQHQALIAGYVKILADKANKEGAEAVRQAVEITVKDETSDGVETQQPTPALTAQYYSGQVQFGGWFGN